MAIEFPENLVAYHADVEDSAYAVARFEQISTLMLNATSNSSIHDLQTRRSTLEWQIILQQADGNFRAQRYEHALADYRNVSRKILALIDARTDRLRMPTNWPFGEDITNALVSASAGLLNNLAPEITEVPPVLQLKDVVRLEELGSTEQPVVRLAERVSTEVSALAGRASTAVSLGRWDEAVVLYRKAIDAGQSSDPQYTAELRLNLGALLVQHGESVDAIASLKSAEDQFRELDDELGIAEALHNAGLAHLRAGSGEKAVELLNQARTAASQSSLRGLLEANEVQRPSDESDQRDRRLRANILLQPNGGLHIGNTPSLLNNFQQSKLANNELTRLPLELNPTGLGEPITSRPVGADAGKLAASLGSFDLSLRLRPISNKLILNVVPLETQAQARLDAPERTLQVQAGSDLVTLRWSQAERLKDEVLVNSIYRTRINASSLLHTGLRIRQEADAIVNLPHVYNLALPIKLADCHHHLGEHAEAQTQYQRASQYHFINLTNEAPDLWRRIAENIVDWGDSLYRAGRTEAAIPIYELLMTPERRAGDSFVYTTPSLTAIGDRVREWLTAIADDTSPPRLNPAIAHLLHTVRLRWTNIDAGLDFFGNVADIVSPFSFRYLQEVARYFAQRASSTEQRYIEFYTRFESGEMTRKDLQNAADLSQLEVDAARERENAANATVDTAEANDALASLRRQNTQDQLDQFNDASWELESLAGHIARGNAWTGGDLPNLEYNAGGRYSFDGPKHEVMQQLTRRQTQISNDLQSSRMQDNVAEMTLAETVAEGQRNVARAQREAARIESQIAIERAEHAGEMLEAFNDRRFNPEQWLHMANIMRWLSNTALQRATSIARLMEKAYNFENFDNRQTLRDSYRLAYTGNMLGGEMLLSDIDSFTHYHVTRVREKPIPVKWALSLAEQYPGQFSQFARTGAMAFEVDIARLVEAHPGTYRHRLAAAEIEVDGFLPPTGLHGRLTNAGFGRYRDRDGSVNLRLQPAETLILSRYEKRQDSILLTSPPEMRAFFEGNSAASGWTLEVPRSSNDVDLNVVFDIRLVLYFECLYDRELFASDTQPPAAELLRHSRALYLRHHFPDAYYQLRETGTATLDLTAFDFPRHQTQPSLRSLALAFTSAQGTSLEGAQLSVSYPGTAARVEKTLNAQQLLPSAELAINGEPSATGRYELVLDTAHKDNVVDLALVMVYDFTPA